MNSIHFPVVFGELIQLVLQSFWWEKASESSTQYVLSAKFVVKVKCSLANTVIQMPEESNATCPVMLSMSHLMKCIPIFWFFYTVFKDNDGVEKIVFYF